MTDSFRNELILFSNSVEFSDSLNGAELNLLKFSDKGRFVKYLEECIYPQFVVIIDNPPSLNGKEIIELAQENGIKHQFIIISPENSVSKAVEAIKVGADDYFVSSKPTVHEILSAIEKNWGLPLNSKKSKKNLDKERFESILLTRLNISELSLNHTLDELIQIVIDESEQLTKSSIGFFHFLSKDQKTLTLQTWSTNTLEKMCLAEGKGSHYPVEKAGVWADCVRTRKPLFHNDYNNLPNKKGLPEGHAPIIRELVIPIFEGDSIVAILGVGNKETNYDDSDVQSLNLLSQYAWDIIKSKKTEENLKESEEQHRYMFENNPQPMFIFDLETLRFVQANNAFIKHLGYSIDELLNMTLFDIHLKEDIKAVKEDIEKTKRSSNPTGVWRNVKKNGEVIFSEIVAHTIFYNNKISRHILVNDITKRKKVEDALIESEDRYRSLFNNSTIGLYRTTPSGEIILANPTIIKLLGYESFEELAKRNLEIEGYEPSYPRSMFRKKLEMVGEVFGMESTWLKKNGTKVYVRESAKAIKGLNGEILYYEGTIEDITEKKIAEEKLIKSSTQWQVTFDTVQDAVCLLDKDHSIIRCNQVMAELFPEHGKEMIGKHCWEVVHRSLKPLLNCPVNKVRNSLKRESIEVKIEDKWFDITVDPIFDSENGYAGAVHILRDISERKKSEETLLNLNNQLKALNNTKDKLFSIIAHDLKSPFNSILGFSDLLINNLHTFTDDKIDEFVGQINISAKSTLSLIDNLLVWANSQMGHFEFKIQEIDLLSVVQKTIEQLSITARIKNIKISFFQAEDYKVLADLNMLEIIFRNLIANAIKFSNNNSKITIYAISINNEVEISVSDSGVGISKEISLKLFSENEYITTKGTANERGSGLGLMICKEFVEKLDGKIWVESEVGIGSEFKFTIPKSKTDFQ